MILLRLGRAKLNGIRKTITSRIWIESMVCRWSSSGKYSQESLRWTSSKRLKVQWETYSVNLSTSKTRSCSCQCTTTSNGEQKETIKDVNTIHRQLRNMLVNPSAVIGLAWSLEQKRNGTETYTDKPDGSWDRMAQGIWWWISQVRVIQCLWERRIDKQRTWKEVYTIQG